MSSAAEAVANLPSSFADFAKLKEQFGSKGLTVQDLAILSGIVVLTMDDSKAMCDLLYCSCCTVSESGTILVFRSGQNGRMN